ncbi:MAG: KilA-N domain-containing protein [Pigmentiphaga sp.]
MSNIVPMDFEGQAIRFTSDGWIHATEAAKRFGKRPQHWLDTEQTAEYIREALDELAEQDPEIFKSRNPDLLVEVRKGRYGGTWIHPELAIEFARWLSPKFARACDRHIKAMIRSQSITYSDEQIVAMLTLTDATTWEKRFADPFYRALGRLTSMPFTGHASGTPPLFGKITAEWVYGVALPKPVYEAAKSRCRAGEKIHQYLADDALRAVEAQLIAITALANGCVDYQDFVSRCTAAYKRYGQLRLIYPQAA